jgi:hypothetical protein
VTLQRENQLRLGQDEATYQWYKDEYLKANKSPTLMSACKGFNISQNTYHEFSDFCGKSLLEGGAYKMNMATTEATWKKWQIVQDAKEDARFAFLLNTNIPQPWYDWALDGIFKIAAAWLVKNNGVQTPRRKRTIDMSSPGSSALPSAKKTKIAPQASMIIIEFADIKGERGELEISVMDILRDDCEPLLRPGKKSASLNYA